MTLNHHISLTNIKPQKICQNGSRTDVTVNELPALKGMSLSLLNLTPTGIREPHWHPNAHELSYCLEGKGLMTIFSPGSGHDTFTISPGEIVFVPQGYIHHIENIGSSPLKLLICFNHENPEDLNLSAGISSMPNHILGETFGLDPQFFEHLKKNINGVFISKKLSTNDNEQIDVVRNAFLTNHFKMNVENEQAQVSNAGGNVKMSNSFLMPTLEGLSLYAVNLAKGGAREPHWHPNASELNYLISGNARITLVSPGGKVETFDMQPGDMSFLPQGYLHHIENVSNINSDPAHFAIFFNHSAPSDIGFSGSLGAYSNEVLASLFGVGEDYFKILPKYQQDLLVIGGG